jgi:hypothetical protein
MCWQPCTLRMVLPPGRAQWCHSRPCPWQQCLMDTRETQLHHMQPATCRSCCTVRSAASTAFPAANTVLQVGGSIWRRLSGWCCIHAYSLVLYKPRVAQGVHQVRGAQGALERMPAVPSAYAAAELRPPLLDRDTACLPRPVNALP